MKLPNPFFGRRPRLHLASMLESFPKNENYCDVVLMLSSEFRKLRTSFLENAPPGGPEPTELNGIRIEHFETFIELIARAVELRNEGKAVMISAGRSD